MSSLSDRQRDVLQAIAVGNVADRYHLRNGWATRRTDVTSRGRGGGMGLNVSTTAQGLAAKGLAVPGTEDPGRLFGDRVWILTDAGRAELGE